VGDQGLWYPLAGSPTLQVDDILTPAGHPIDITSFFLQKPIPKTWQNSHPIFMAVGYQVTLWYTKNHGQITMFNGKTHNISMAIFQVHSLPEHAAFSCEGSTSFFIAAVLHLVGMLDDLRKHEKTIGFIPGGLPELTSEIQKHTVGG